MHFTYMPPKCQGVVLVKQLKFILKIMKKEKLSFKGIKNVISRDELKNIMAGSGPGTPGGGGGGTPPGCQPCMPSCTNVLVYCADSNGASIGTILATTCDHYGQVQLCKMAGYTATTQTRSNCTC